MTPPYYQQPSPLGRQILDRLGCIYLDTCIDSIREMERVKGWKFDLLCAVRYLWRLGQKTKDIESDLNKAIDYLQWSTEYGRADYSEDLIRSIRGAILRCQDLTERYKTPFYNFREHHILKDDPLQPLYLLGDSLYFGSAKRGLERVNDLSLTDTTLGDPFAGFALAELKFDNRSLGNVPLSFREAARLWWCLLYLPIVPISASARLQTHSHFVYWREELDG